MEPAHGFALNYGRNRRLDQFAFGKNVMLRADCIQPPLDLLLCVGRTKKPALHQVLHIAEPRSFAEAVIDGVGSAERASGITCGRLNPKVLERAVAQHLTVCDAVQRDTAGEAEIGYSDLAGQGPRQPQHGFLQHSLNRRGEVHMPLRQRLIRLARQAPEQIMLPATRRTAPNPLRYLERFFAQPRLQLAWALAAGRAGWWAMFFVYAPILAVTSGLGAQAGGLIVSIGTGWIWLVPLWGILAQRFGVRGLMMTGFTGAGILSLLAAASIGSGWRGPLVLLMAGLCVGTLDGVGNVLFLRAVHPYERAEMTAVFVSYRDVAQLAPPGVFALLLLFMPLSSVFAASGVAMLALASLTRYIPRRL